MFDWGRTLYDRHAVRKNQIVAANVLATDIDTQILAKAKQGSIETTNCGMSQQNVPVFDAKKRTNFRSNQKSNGGFILSNTIF